MIRRACIFLTAFLLSLIVVPVTFAQTTGVGGPYGEYAMAYQGPETLTLFVVPDGSGDSFDQATLPIGGTEDATITVLIVDAGGVPIASFPAEDIWLESEDNGLIPCIGGTIADANTGADGTTQWLNPVLGGGHSQALTVVLVNGALLESTSGVRLSFNSPDINGDRTVNLSDVQLFSVDFFSGDNFRSDFYRDGIVNLSDLAMLAQTAGANCP
jgi:hypothetical protein